MIEELRVENKDTSTVPLLDGTRTPVGLTRLAYALYASAASFAEFHNQSFTAEPNRVTVEEKRFNSPNNATSSFVATIPTDSKGTLHARLSHWGTVPATSFLQELKEKYRVSSAAFLVDERSYLTTLAKTDFSDHLDYTDRTIVEKLFQTPRCRSTVSTRPGRAVSQAPVESVRRL